MFVLVWVRHEHQHGVSIQISINLGKTFLWIHVFLYEIFLRPESWQESLHSYLLTFPRLLTLLSIERF